MASKAFNLRVNALRQELLEQLEQDWAGIQEDFPDHIKRTRIVNSIERVVRDFLKDQDEPCSLVQICKHYKV